LSIWRAQASRKARMRCSGSSSVTEASAVSIASFSRTMREATTAFSRLSLSG
jgi:hypothetical protein